jgi:triacylglycerol lipase
MENRTLLFLAQCSRLAYRLKRDKSVPKLNLKIHKYLRDQDNQIRGFLATRGDEAIISIKGTDSLKDAEFDVNVVKTDWRGVRVHSGFYDCFDAIWPDVRDFLKPHHSKVYVTGHSLGAAIASLLAVAITDLKITPSIATFGSPRVGDDAWVALFNSLIKDCVRVVHEFDIVTRIPKIDFGHVDKVLHLNDKGQIMGLFRCSYNFFAELFQRGEILIADLDGEALRNHKMTTYLKAVKKHAAISIS